MISSERKNKLLAGVVLSVAMAVLGGCGASVDLDGPVEMLDSYTFSRSSIFALKDEEVDDELQREFYSADANRILLASEEGINFCTIEAYSDYWAELIVEGYSLEGKEDVKVTPYTIDGIEDCYNLAWEGQLDGEAIYGECYIMINEGVPLVIMETGAYNGKKKVSNDIAAVANSVIYTGETRIPTEYPIEVDYEALHLTIDEGAVLLQNEPVQIRFLGGDSLEAGNMNRITLEIDDTYTKPKDKADQSFEGMSDRKNIDCKDVESGTLGKYFPEICDELKDVEVFYYSYYMSTLDVNFENYFFEIDGKVYELRFTYIGNNNGLKEHSVDIIETMQIKE